MPRRGRARRFTPYHLRSTRAPLLRAARNLALQTRVVTYRGHPRTPRKPIAGHLDVNFSPQQRVTRFTAAPTQVCTAFWAPALRGSSQAPRSAERQQVGIRPTFSFQQRSERVNGELASSHKERQARVELSRQQHRRHEFQFYHKRPRLRLPRTTVTRRRRRKGGLGLFARHTLKRPRTLLGVKNLLLPPRKVYTSSAFRVRAGSAATPRALRALTVRSNENPRI